MRNIENVPVDVGEAAEGSPWFAELYEQLAPVRVEASSPGEAEVDEAIKEAVEARRREYRDS